MKENDPIDLNQERILNQKIASLATEEATPRELWSGIRSNINIAKVKSPTSIDKKNIWASWTIAASLLISVASLSFSWNNLRQAESLYAKIELKNIEQKMDYRESVYYQVDLMEQEFKLARVGLMSQISMNRNHIDKSLLSEIERDLSVINKAAAILKTAIKKQPGNTEYPKLLRSAYQQELAVLTQLAKLDTSI